MAKKTFSISLLKDENSIGVYWKSDTIKLSNIMREVGGRVQFTIWNPPAATSDTPTVILEVGEPYRDDAREPYFYNDSKKRLVSYSGMWHRSGEKNGKPYEVISSSTIDIATILGQLGDEVKMFVSKARQKKNDKSPDYGCTIVKAIRNQGGSGVTSGVPSVSQANTLPEDDIPF